MGGIQYKYSDTSEKGELRGKGKIRRREEKAQNGNVDPRGKGERERVATVFEWKEGKVW